MICSPMVNENKRTSFLQYHTKIFTNKTKVPVNVARFLWPVGDWINEVPHDCSFIVTRK